MNAILSLIPSPRAIRVIAFGAPLWLVAFLLPGGWLVGAVYLILVIALCARDALSIAQPGELVVRRELPSRFALGVEHMVKLSLRNQSAQAVFAAIVDEIPASFERLGDLPPVRIPPRGEAQLSYAVRPLQRGVQVFGAVVLRARGERGLIERQITLPVADTAKVYPNFRGADQYQLLAKIDQREEVARRPRPFRAAGTDFESLRPYVDGEDPRSIDWKATARRGALISRNRQVEKGQQLAVLLDSGRLMAETIGEQPRLEHALNATVMLSYVAQKRGDALALAAFSNKIEAFLPPVRGPALLGRVLESLYAVQPRPVESDYWQVIAQLMAMLRRRSLVILLSDVLDASASAGLIHNLARAAEKHIVLCVVLIEPAIADIARSVPATVEEVYRKAAACDLLRRRSLALENMRARGILVLETDPAHLSVHLVKRYLEIRQADLQ
jgi:uncharacterized protein (DUF58 family)